ncbi:MAG: hypothetical protein J6X55_18030 [Victivallales bacterium]|nr:hypothetical protein [Victivallales bacterium]
MNHWPTLKHYDQEHLVKIALPLGGIGTGTISLGGRGDFRNCEIEDHPAKGSFGIAPFFCIQAQEDGGQPFAKALEGPLPEECYEGSSGVRDIVFHGAPRFKHACFDTAYPFGEVRLFESKAPVDVTLQAFNPLVPTDTDASGFPVAILRYNVKNKLGKALDVSVCGIVTNTIGKSDNAPVRKNSFSSGEGHKGLVGIEMTSDSDCGDPSDGEVVLAAMAHERVSYRTKWINKGWGMSFLDFWDDFSEDGMLDEREGTGPSPMASLCVRKSIPANGEEFFTFIIAWRFPNRRTWTPLKPEQRVGIDPKHDPDNIGNYYATRFPTAWAAAEEVVTRLPELEQRTIDFVSAFLQSPVPDVVKEAALFNVSTLRTQTAFRTADGNFFGWEGCNDSTGSCLGSCTHVWNYEQTTAFLFGSLARNMRETEFLHATHDTGFMSFRVNLPLERAKNGSLAAADGQLGCIMKVYRDWKLCGDDAFLKKLWSKVKTALEFCWVDKGWDGNKDGVIEGCQHNTMDVEYYGPNGQMQGWYLGALKCAELMADAMGDTAFAETCRDLGAKGSAYMDGTLFNGEYYEQVIIPPMSEDNIYPGLRYKYGTSDFVHPDVQLDKACLVDQLVGIYFARILGLPELLDREHVKTTLQSIYRYNRRVGFHDHFNDMRSFVAGDESALLMASYPHGDRPKFPFPYFSEVMTGFEYTAAVGMLYEGMEAEGLQVISDIRARYDGKKRSPFDEAECGHHYARAMAAWSAYLALSEFHYDGCTGEMALTGKNGVWFWSTGNAYGTCAVLDGMVRFHLLEGSVKLNTLHVGDKTFKVNETLSGRSTLRL